MKGPRILCISFSDIRSDSRVLRQLDQLTKFGRVTTLSYGEAPPQADDHIQIDSGLPSLPQTVSGVLNLALRRYKTVQLEAPAVQVARAALGSREFDLVVANEARALPLASVVAGQPKILCDLHEWAPAERTHVLSWRLLVAPFMHWVCATYLPRVAASTTVNSSIAEMYQREFGVRPEVVRNAIAYRPDLAPTTLDPERIRLVHSGGAVAGRNIEALVEAVDVLGDGYSLDLYLIPGRQRDAYWAELQKRIAQSPGTTLHPPVLPADLPDVLNAYDLGVFSLPPLTPNHKLMLPNKFFDFVQARLGIVFSTAEETDRLIREYKLGAVAEGFGADELVRAIGAMSRADVAAAKSAADDAAEKLSSATDLATQDRILSELLLGGASKHT
ncbi:hypothetical protein AB0O87_07845 [Microbacterium sp. NPDC076768]|uniref:hypothetical protein n=1 Tax=Microbacterium sp. NPDC076768 TaxID=3154858 RepID=UPI00343C94A5